MGPVSLYGEKENVSSFEDTSANQEESPQQETDRVCTLTSNFQRLELCKINCCLTQAVYGHSLQPLELTMLRTSCPYHTSPARKVWRDSRPSCKHRQVTRLGFIAH